MEWKQILISIDENIENEMSVKDLANMAGYSEFYFLRKFKDFMGMTPMDYVQKRRLIKASERILVGQRIIDVAIQYGWQSYSGFTRAFKKEFGFHPSLLRIMAISEGGVNLMSHVFLKNMEVGTKKEQLYAILKSYLQNSEYLEEAYIHAIIAYQDVLRYSGEEYITHPLNVAILLAELEADENMVLAGLFCDVMKKGRINLSRLNGVLPQETVEIIQKLHENIIDWNDERVLLVKLAERLHNMRTIQYRSEEARVSKAQETMDFFLPLAKKIANEKLRNELNDLTMKYL